MCVVRTSYMKKIGQYCGQIEFVTITIALYALA